MENDKVKIIEYITLDDVRKCLDKIGVNSKFVEEENGRGQLITIISADESFDHDIIITFEIQGENNDWLKMQTFANEFEINNDDVLMAYLIANKYNNFRRYGKLYIDHYFSEGEKKTVYVYEEHLVADQMVSNDLLASNIQMFLSSSWEVFNSFIKVSRKDFEDMVYKQNKE